MVSLAREENITGNTGNNAKNANSALHSFRESPIRRVYKIIHEKINGAAINWATISRYKPKIGLLKAHCPKSANQPNR